MQRLNPPTTNLDQATSSSSCLTASCDLQSKPSHIPHVQSPNADLQPSHPFFVNRSTSKKTNTRLDLSSPDPSPTTQHLASCHIPLPSCIIATMNCILKRRLRIARQFKAIGKSVSSWARVALRRLKPSRRRPACTTPDTRGRNNRGAAAAHARGRRNVYTVYYLL